MSACITMKDRIQEMQTSNINLITGCPSRIVRGSLTGNNYFLSLDPAHQEYFRSQRTSYFRKAMVQAIQINNNAIQKNFSKAVKDLWRFGKTKKSKINSFFEASKKNTQNEIESMPLRVVVLDQKYDTDLSIKLICAKELNELKAYKEKRRVELNQMQPSALVNISNRLVTRAIVSQSLHTQSLPQAPKKPTLSIYDQKYPQSTLSRNRLSYTSKRLNHKISIY